MPENERLMIIDQIDGERRDRVEIGESKDVYGSDRFWEEKESDQNPVSRSKSTIVKKDIDQNGD